MLRPWVRALALLPAVACGANSTDPTFSSGGKDETAAGTASEDSETTDGLCDLCTGNLYTPCGGAVIDCELLTCVDALGCVECRPGQATCVGNDIHDCNDDGTPGGMTGTCDAGAGEVCSGGTCADACSVAGEDPSNLGCQFWAVDLPNSRGIDDASEDEWGVALANGEGETATVIVERNLADPGQPMDLQIVATQQIPPGTLTAISLPRGEVTGWTMATLEPPGPPGTFHSSKAFRITSSAPIVAYQFNNFTNNFATDASLLLPQTGLGNTYRVIGYPTANPIGIPGLTPPGIPDRSHVTIVGVQANTTVTFRATHLTTSDMIGIPILNPGESYTTVIGPFDTLNFASSGIPGDFTGSVVEASGPVAVFSAGERAIGPVLTTPPTPPGWDDNLCCTDHMEEQMFPVTSLGTNFVIAHSPYRGSSYIEPDELRFLGVAEPSTVTTTLPPPWDNFTLQPGDVVDAYTQGDVIVEATQPIMIAQMLASQTHTEDVIGDPSLTVFPPVEQYRDNYLFLVPESWTRNAVVITAPVGATYSLDGQALPTSCTTNAAGALAGVEYESIRCDVSVGVHNVTSVTTKGTEGPRFGLAAYGYGLAGSFAYAGGADVAPIYNPPPIP